MSTVLVTSRDGIVFRVETDRRAAAFEAMYAGSRDADALEQHGDFVRVRSLDDLVAPEPPPPRPRPRLVLIQGGKS
jgi:hypothetical protein